MHYKNFKTVLYCVTSWVNHVTEEQLRKEADFFRSMLVLIRFILKLTAMSFLNRNSLIL